MQKLLDELGQLGTDAGRIQRRIKAICNELAGYAKQAPGREVGLHVEEFVREYYETPDLVDAVNQAKRRAGLAVNENATPFIEKFQDVWKHWAQHAKAQGFDAGPPWQLGRGLKDLGFKRIRSANKRAYGGLRRNR